MERDRFKIAPFLKGWNEYPFIVFKKKYLKHNFMFEIFSPDNHPENSIISRRSLLIIV